MASCAQRAEEYGDPTHAREALALLVPQDRAAYMQSFRLACRDGNLELAQELNECHHLADKTL